MANSNSYRRDWRGAALPVVLAWGTVGLAAVGCSGGNNPGDPMERQRGQSEFASAPPGGVTNSGATGGGADASAAADAASSPGASERAAGDSTRRVEETDIYRLDGNRLYYLNGYRGLMVFDVADLDHPRLLGRAPLFGSPVEMIVRDGVAYALVADWYGRGADGRPFHGSVVRAIDARDVRNIRVTSEAQLEGWVRDARVVGDVLYTVSEDYGWSYADDYSGTYRGPRVTVSSVNLADPAALRVAGSRTWEGYSGVFNVTQNAILMAHDVNEGGGGWSPRGQTEINYVDISDPAGAIALRGSIRVNGRVQGWGANNGRFNLDYDGTRYVRTLAVNYGDYSGGGTPTHTYVLSTVDASDPDRLALVGEFNIASTGWTPAARFDRNRMYLSPSGYWSGSGSATPVQVYDLGDPARPRLAGETTIDGAVWNFIPAGDRLFALGIDYNRAGGHYSSSDIALRYLDVADPANPRVLGTSQFGAGWAWTPAAGDFKAFTMDATRGLIVLPFSGWDHAANRYHNGVQLVEFTRDSLSTAGAAHTRGWVERGIFVRDRLLSLSDLALQVIDYTDRARPRVVTELTLARNVVAAEPMGATIAELSTDWWGNGSDSTLRVLPIGDPDDEQLTGALSEVTVPGTNARVFHHGALAYVVSTLRMPGSCGGGHYGCDTFAPHVQVVDLSDPRRARLRGALTLPTRTGYYYGYWGGWWGWWDGDSVVQVNGDVLAFREPGEYDYYSRYGGGARRPGQLHVVDLSNPDSPRLASTAVVPTPDAWWGNLRVVGDTLYATHYEWIDRDSRYWTVRYYLDRIDLSDRAHPRVLRRVNIPGIFVGASPDQRQIYTVDYRWASDRAVNTFNVLDLERDRAYLRSSVDVTGWVGRVFVQGTRAYLSADHWDATGSGRSTVRLHMLDFTNPDMIVDRASAAATGWGWLLGVEGDRAIVQTGWGAGVSVYRLSDAAAPEFLSFQRTRGWWGGNVARQGDTVYLASGYWGVQTIPVGR